MSMKIYPNQILGTNRNHYKFQVQILLKKLNFYRIYNEIGKISLKIDKGQKLIVLQSIIQKSVK